jgi:glutathione reductase (NADPH)
MSSNYDLIVIGAGNAGQAAAGIAREAGWSVLVVESRDVGGTCPLRGCVPKKVLVAAGETLDAIARAPIHRIRVGKPKLDWSKLIRRKQTFVAGVPEAFEKSLKARGIDVLHGRARFVGRTEIAVGTRRFSARKILVATGSKPRRLPFAGAEHMITSDDILDMRRLPASVVFVGGGVIALEFTHLFARAGARVTILEVMPQPLPELDLDCVARLAEATRALGVKILTGVEIAGIEKRGRDFVVRFRHEGRWRSVGARCVANGAGRVADLEDLGLEAAGVTREGPRVDLDEFLRSRSNPDVFFAGDAIATKPQLSPIATYEGKIVGHNLTRESMAAPEYVSSPSVVFSVPALASVGWTEDEARERGRDFDVKQNDMREWRSARTYAETTAFAKVLVEKGSGHILGAHLLGHGAAETIHAFAFAIRHGVTADELRETVYAYPTFHSDVKFLV